MHRKRLHKTYKQSLFQVAAIAYIISKEFYNAIKCFPCSLYNRCRYILVSKHNYNRGVIKWNYVACESKRKLTSDTKWFSDKPLSSRADFIMTHSVNASSLCQIIVVILQLYVLLMSDSISLRSHELPVPN